MVRINKKIIFNESESLVDQIVTMISRDIEKGDYQLNQRLLSITNSSKAYGVARDTMEKAYHRLRLKGYIKSIKGKGYYANSSMDNIIMILMIFDDFDVHQNQIHNALVNSTGNKASVSVRLHNKKTEELAQIINENIGQYHYFVVMSTLGSEKDLLTILRRIPANQLILLGKDIPSLESFYTVFRDHKSDIYNLLSASESHFSKYSKLIYVYRQNLCTNHPTNTGLQQFAQERFLEVEIVDSLNKRRISKGEVYLIQEDNDLIFLLKAIEQNGLTLGKEVGIISYGDNPFKELLNITIIESNFEEMGKTIAQVVLTNNSVKVKNPFRLVKRASL